MIPITPKWNARIVNSAPEGEPESVVLQTPYNNTTYELSNVKWVFDYVGPTGVISYEGLMRQATQLDFENVINNFGGNCQIQFNKDKEIILYYITKPE